MFLLYKTERHIEHGSVYVFLLKYKIAAEIKVFLVNAKYFYLKTEEFASKVDSIFVFR